MTDQRDVTELSNKEVAEVLRKCVRNGCFDCELYDDPACQDNIRRRAAAIIDAAEIEKKLNVGKICKNCGHYNEELYKVTENGRTRAGLESYCMLHQGWREDDDYCSQFARIR